MAQRIKRLHRAISVTLVEAAIFDILRFEFDDMLKKMPEAQYVELVLVERYDDGKPE